MKTRKLLTLATTGLMALAMAVSCTPKGDDRVAKVIEEAETMTTEQLYRKAAEEINGKKLTVVSNTSRLSDKNIRIPFAKLINDNGWHDGAFDFEIVSTQPKNNQIFEQIKSDVTGNNHNLSLVHIQDALQVQNKMIAPGYLLNYVPKEWSGSNDEPLALQSLNKVFAYNDLTATGEGKTVYNNSWDFALMNTQFMTPNSEPVGQNFLIMLTKSEYAAYVKDAYDALDATRKAKIDADIADANTGIENTYVNGGFTDPNVKYSLAWIYNFIKNYTAVSDDGPISQNLARKSSAGAAGLLVFSKFRSIVETADVSNAQIQIAAHQEDFKGFGGFMYNHYLQIPKTSVYPYAAAALIHYMTTNVDGFQPWGKDVGGYASDDATRAYYKNLHDVEDVNKEFDCVKDRGYEWWMGKEAKQGRLVAEDGAYLAEKGRFVVEWMTYLR